MVGRGPSQASLLPWPCGRGDTTGWNPPGGHVREVSWSVGWVEGLAGSQEMCAELDGSPARSSSQGNLRLGRLGSWLPVCLQLRGSLTSAATPARVEASQGSRAQAAGRGVHSHGGAQRRGPSLLMLTPGCPLWLQRQRQMAQVDALERNSRGRCTHLPSGCTLPVPRPQPLLQLQPCLYQLHLPGEERGPSSSSLMSGCGSHQPHRSPRRNAPRAPSGNPPPPALGERRAKEERGWTGSAQGQDPVKGLLASPSAPTRH